MTTIPENTRDGSPVDVIIVGAGYAGLTAADQLVSEGRSVLVLEGRDRVGGRAFTGQIAGVPVDLGATWVAERHTDVHRVAEQVGCTTTSQFDEGNNILFMAGERLPYLGALPNGGPVDQEDLGRVQEQLETLLATVDVEAAWQTPNAAELDAISFEQWLDDLDAARSTRELMTVVTKVQWGCSPGDVSLLHALRYLRAGGGLVHMLSVEGGQQQHRIAGGSQQIAERLAERLGERVVINSPVQRITSEQDGVTVATDNGTFRGRYVISTTAPAHRANIEFDPELPAQGEGLAHTWRMGALSKAFVAYDKPFWREEGLSGEAVADSGIVFITFDVSPSDDGPGILMAFCDPRVYDGFNLDDRRARVIEELADLYGPSANNPIDYIDHRWGAESFAPGGPNPSVPQYALTSYGPALAAPHGRIHWAGSETAGAWAGTLNGAVLTGQRAAKEVGQLLADNDR